MEAEWVEVDRDEEDPWATALETDGGINNPPVTGLEAGNKDTTLQEAVETETEILRQLGWRLMLVETETLHWLG